MPLPRPQWISLTTRIVVGVQLVFLASVWSLVGYANSSLLADMERDAGEHQRREVSILGRRLESQFEDLLGAMRLVASDISESMLHDPAAVARLLAQRPLLTRQFNAGVAVIRRDGATVASTPNAALSAETNTLDNPAVAATLADARTAIQTWDRPTGGSGSPMLTLSVPVAVREGHPLGVLVGLVSLEQSSLLAQTELARESQGQSQGLELLLIDPQAHRIVVSTSLRDSLRALPANQALAPEDRMVAEASGSAIYRNADGIEVLGSSYVLSTPAWRLIATQPTAQAFAAAQRQRQKLLLAASVLSALSLLLGIPWLRSQFRPIQRTAAALRAMSTGQRAQTPLPLPRQAEVAELVAGFNSLLTTLTEREALLRDLFNTSSVGILLVDTRARLTQANTHMGELFRCSVDQLIGLEYAELVAPQERELGRTRTEALIAGQFETVDVDRQFLRRDGSIFWGRLTGRRMLGPAGEMRGLVGTITDITERKVLQQFEQFRSRTLELLAADEPLESLLLETVRGLESILPDSKCSCLLLSPDGTTLEQCFDTSLPDFYRVAIRGLAIGPDVGSCGASAYLQQRVVAENLQTHPNWAPFRDLVRQADLGSCWSQPVMGSDGRVLGTFAVYHATPHTPGNLDIVLIEQAARLVSIAIERSHVAQRLRDSEEHFRLLTEGVDDVVWRLDANRVFTYISPADERMRGFPSSEVIGRSVFDLITADSAEVIREVGRIREQAADAEQAAQTQTLVLEQLCKNGGTVWTEIRSTVERDPKGHITGYRGITRDITARRALESRLQLAASVMTHAQEGIMITSAQGTILDVNQAFSRITGYTREEAVGAQPSMLQSGRHDASFYQSMMATLAAHGQWQGEFWNRRKDGTLYAQRGTISAVADERGVVQHYVSLFSDVTEHKEKQLQLEHRAHFDTLTDLPNRALMMDRLRQAMVQAQRRQLPLALVFIDLDGFKPVNDLHGHAIGDALLQILATRMRAALRDGDTLARLGGDEFIAILVDLPNHDASTPLLQRLLLAVSQPTQVTGHTLQVSASLGVSFFPQSLEVDADTLLRQADHAMYQAKLAGKNRCERYVAKPAGTMRD